MKNKITVLFIVIFNIFSFSNSINDLFNAVCNQNIEEVKIILENKNLNLNYRNEDYRTVLDTSSINNYFDTFKVIYNSGLELTKETMISAYGYAIYYNSYNIVKYILDNYGTYDYTNFLPDDSAVNLSIIRKNFEITELLLERNVKYNDEAIVLAAKENNFELIKYFVNAGISVNTNGWHEYTPLYYAIKNKNYEMTEYLIKNGADTNAISWENETILDIAIYTGLDFVKLLVENKCNLNQMGKYYPPLTKAIISRKKNTAEYLLEKGADVTLKDKTGKAVYDYVKGKPNLMKILKSYLQ
ncbi:UNC-44 ankyrin [Tepiditoga spiralis]|uniref:UNC-44 ankyrin n=1 Tax=Tepiditoga spiralis TaxID=2108365 RepID=A0A7G1G649_9BACT|nr:ankyrin repeat domain-containing protein [Tepiditoga spiralis]BBE32038.1 UNC-44 ankyrin [Tepiditoga spiralis]